MTDRTDDRSDAERYGTHLASGLTALADAPAPESRLDTARAIRTGRTRLRRRRAGAIGAVAAVLLGAMVAGAALPSGGPETPRPADGTTALPWFGPDTGRDPMTVDATFGWLPPGFDQFEYNAHPNRGRLDITVRGPKAASTGLLDPSISLALFAPGEQPPTPRRGQDVPSFLIDTAPVNGRPAYWRGTRPDNPTNPGGQRILRFLAPDGRWAELTAVYLDESVQEKELPRIAAGVRTTRKTAALPFTVTNLPPEYSSKDGYFSVGTAAAGGYPWMASLTYFLGDGYVTLVARPDVTPDPAYDNPPQPGQEASPSVCKIQRGLRLCAGSAQGDAPFAAAGGLQGWLDRVTGLGTDPAGWTTDVLR
ncbi:hypothetical protein ACFCX4_30690 [Kitasatospora sp. NPDC056327]|uniref:hypothetical protein n=1 Tax=Kitasatospora sp. NPDC056327 TaxID=3345785 RepID=UPI0035DC67AE